MKKITLLFILFLAFSSLVFSQQDIYWRADASVTNWWDASNPWYRTSDSWWIARPDYNTYNDNTTIGGNYLHFDNNNQVNMNVNGAWFKLYTLTFETTATSSRTLTADGSGGLSFNAGTSYITNLSSASHIFSTGIGIDGSALIINASAGDFTFNSPIHINSNALTFTGSYNSSVGGILSGSGTLTKSDSGILTLTGANTYTGLTTISAGTLKLNKTGGTTIPVTNNVTVNSGTLQISSNQTIANLDLSGTGNLTIDAGVIFTITGTYTSGSGTINNLGTIVLQGSSLQTFPGNSTIINNGTVNTMTNLTIDNSTGVSLDKSISVSGALTINSNKILNVNPVKQLTVSTSLTNNGTMNLLSDASGTATILTPGTSNISGTFKVQQYLSSARNWYISSPVTGATASANYTYYKYDEPGNNPADPILSPATAYWERVPASTTLLPATGYIANLASGTSTLEFTGTLNNGDKTVSLTRTTGKTKEGFNLIGNPYPSHITWTTDLATSANVNSTIWYRTYDSGYTFQTYNAAGTIGAPIETTPYIPPMQGFWVRVNTVAGGTLTFTNTMRYHKSSNPLKAPSTTNNVNKVLRLEVTNGTNKDETVVYSNDNALDTYDTYDSSKFPNSSDSYPEIYTVVGSEQLVINGMSSLPINTVIPLGFKSLKKGLNSFSMKASQFSNFDSDIKIVLKDVENTSNSETDITDGTPYSFTSDSITTESRFSIIFKSISGTTALNTEIEDNIVIYKNADNHISVKTNNNIEGNINVYNSLGQKVVDKPMTGNLTIIKNPLKAGIYIVTVTNSVKTSAKQVVIF